jgi:glutamate formiminotransferase
MKTILALKKIGLSSLSYREVIIYEDGHCYLENVNIILNNKIIKKIRFKTGEKLYEKSMGKEIVEEYILSLIQNVESQPSTDQRTKEYVSRTAKRKAASDLMSDLGI